MSLRRAIFLAREDLRLLVGRPEVLLWALAMPPVFLAFFGTIAEVVGPRRSGALPIVVEPAGAAADGMRARLAELGLDAREPGATTGPARRLVLAAEPDAPATLVLTGDGLAATRDVFAVRVARGLERLAAGAGTRAAEEAPPLRVVREGVERARAGGARQAVPGGLITLVLVTVLANGAALLVAERRGALLVRLAVAGAGAGTVVTGKLLARLGLGIVQLACGAVTAALLFPAGGASVSGLAVAALALVLVALLAAALAVLLGSLFGSEAQALTLGALLANGLALLGGCWVPPQLASPALERLALALPTGWAMDAVLRSTGADGPDAVVALELGGLLLAAVATAALATRVFRFR